ncbi:MULTISPECIES: YihY/virulence factor BrkB family protein [Marivita]|uniref:YihY/virulence factor BrkB family protein n=1 Tax=Marivita cryptomonadis TaxID=505252 RepID=A0A9Q2P7V3_9RHOB|nr:MULTISPECIES: YihY/virulence factor BrkB family protein [Marivita]MCR9167263.1 YihY/virulence factor BrkB family protein [Paracoccaceae bacterium]MBM2320576.1 YihY/virulence factor BrkB family protein [Marivita cryptomonadis]MBM2330156.1 YihY/virulence factor BrkB family protein [Marivita cryptomonadis]MBM2339743.1 YihY/virulence factor BrkB family protein [Marivita cryptomonadis]MBM2344402.1 YihY/virulence factor BrkB family protein [Marivita cryptomonadis]
MSRGRFAHRPTHIPTKGILDVLVRMWNKQTHLNLGLIAAGIAFYGLLSLFPGITAIVAFAGTFLNPEMLVENSEDIAALLPEAAQTIVLGQLRDVANADSSTLSFAALFSLAIALYSASKAVANFIAGLNVIYEERETRNFFVVKALTILLTIFLIVGLLVAIIVVAAIPVIAAIFGDYGIIDDVVMFLRWPFLFLMGAFGIAVLYRLGPNRRSAKWRWLTPGAFVACALWVGGSYGFSLYVQSFGSYNETFGALGGVIILLTWLWLSAFIVLLGALLDAELEAQTKRDSTVGEDRPMGERGAVKADTLGASIGEEITEPSS